MKKLYCFSLMLLALLFVPQAARAEYYGIKVAGVSVTSDNCDNITGEYITPNNEADDYFVRYNPSTKTLTLHNISIVRTGSDNRAILNESCDGLTIVFDAYNYLKARDASPLRFNTNTIITSTAGLYGTTRKQEIIGGNEDAITVSNGAQLTISDIHMDVKVGLVAGEGVNTCFLGNTGNEKLVLVDAFVETDPNVGYGLQDFSLLGVQRSSIYFQSRFRAPVTGLKSLVLVGQERITDNEGHDVYFSEEDKMFLYPENITWNLRKVRILSYIPINEETFPDETFRNYVSEMKDGNSNGELDFLESLKTTGIDTYRKDISSLKGIEHLRFVESLDCSSNNLTYLDLSYNQCLTDLKCNNNQITTLRLSEHPQLTKIDCPYNLLTNIDFSGCPNINDINISGNRIDGWMTDVLESLPDATGSSETHKIKIGNNGANDNVCTQEQANIARNKGWNVILGGIDSEGNIVYDILIGGNYITSANANDLTVLPGVTKNHTDGYARYNPTTNTLYLNGVDIVNQNGIGININTENTDFTIIFGQEPVNVTSSSNGICANVNTLTFTTAEDWWYSQKLKITSGGIAFYVIGNVVLDGFTRIEAISESSDYATRITQYLYVKNDAELRIKARDRQKPMEEGSTNLVLENDNIIVAPEGAYYDTQYRKLRTAEGNIVRGQEVVIGKLRNYNYYVAGTRITNANQHAVLGDTTIVFQEPAYLAGPGTLVLNNANIDGGSSANGIQSSNALTIKLIGENNVVTDYRYGISTGGSATIEGSGSLYAKGARYGITSSYKLNIVDNAKVTAEGTRYYGIAATNEVTISGERTIVRAKCAAEGMGAFMASALTLNDGITIGEPEGAQYVDGEIKDADGNVIKDEWVTILHTEDYGITVAGIKVTNHNREDVLGDGTVSYDPETLTLTLTNANIDGGDGSGIEAEQELHIKLDGSNTITCTRSLNGTSHGVWFKDKGFIEGPGSLSITAMYGIYAIGSNQPKPLQILDGAQVSAEGDLNGIIAGITTISGEETVVNAKGGDGSFGCAAFNLNDGLEITQPEGAKYVMSKLAICVGRRNDIVTSWVTIQKVNKYDLHVKGIQVTSLNQEDVLGDGTVSYNPETSTLTLNGADIEAEGEGLSTQIDEVIIKLEGENSIEAPEGYGIYSDASFTITGPGSLSVTSKFVALNGSFVIEGGAKVTADSQTRSALWSFEPLAVSGSETVVMLKGAKGAVEIYGADSEEAVLSLSDGLVLGLPEGVHCGIVDVLVDEEEDMWIPYGYILDANDNNITDQWVIIASEDYIDGIDNVNANADANLNENTYNLAGQKVGKDYKGIVIVGGRKLLKK